LSPASRASAATLPFVDIAGRERQVVLADHVGRLQVRIRLQQRWPGTAHTGPAASG